MGSQSSPYNSTLPHNHQGLSIHINQAIIPFAFFPLNIPILYTYETLQSYEQAICTVNFQSSPICWLEMTGRSIFYNGHHFIAEAQVDRIPLQNQPVDGMKSPKIVRVIIRSFIAVVRCFVVVYVFFFSLICFYWLRAHQVCYPREITDQLPTAIWN